MRFALVADWLAAFGGAENVIAEFHALYPDAPLFTTIASGASSLGPLSSADIRTSGLQRWYRLLGRHQWLLPWMPRAVEGFDLRGYDVILSSSHAVAKGIIPPSTAVHVCYCHTPMRYAWEMEETYLHDFRIPRLFRPRVRKMLSRLRRWDLTTAKRVDTFIANSTETQRRISRIYGRDSIVVHPPVHDRFLSAELQPASSRKSFLAVGRLVPYKRFDLLIEAANRLQLPLIVAGRGQEESRLRSLAGPTVTFAGFVPDKDLPRLYANARAVLFAPYEDAGIVPLEAQASGTPVIAFGKGGVLDTVKDGETGVLFPEQSVDSVEAAIRRFEFLTLDPQALRTHAKAFSTDRFRDRITSVVEETLARRR